MITQENFINVLNVLKFEQNGQIWTKTFANNRYLKVDFAKKELIYPEDLGLVVNERQTCNFSSPENFVVFECVHRLLEKGYQPKHIELEKKWALGHLQKSGRADICIFADDNKSEMLLIIECKTYGTEYNKALKILKEDGGQLFSYWQQDRSTQWLCLYASDFFNDKIEVKYQSIRCGDDNNLLKLAEQDDGILLYKNAHKKEELHQTWQETYVSQLYDNTIFHEDTIAYQIGVPPLRKKDLKDFSPDDKIINQFEEILRHNAVSDKENAFNRLIALFICKLVDEYHKSEQSEVEFQYKINEDDFEKLQDRLQKLYKEGMEEFMKEEIFYVPDTYAKEIFARYQGENRTHAIAELEETIKHLKFYTNNDFAFKDVHNKELFMQNGKILVEMVQLFEKYRIVYSAKHQFLGDLFEQLLNKGFKQNEGQFFTPSPITRFIWDSLPIQEKFADSQNYPKVIDYACGSGHFLTEAVEAINAVKNPDNNMWVKDSIFGIEKDYRLARVSQVSMFMNGAGDSNIIFGDGLDNHHEDKVVKNENFDILVANPPYSVSAFKSHLSLKNNQLKLLKNISNQGGEIEVLFCERIAQLLKSGGLAAVILPSSILSNDSNSYSSARALLLSAFKIHAIVTLGSKTFGATGTNTVILFLEKFNYPPTINSPAKDCAKVVFLQEDLTAWNDKSVYDAYLNQIHVDVEIYDKIRLKQMTWEELNNINNDYIQSNIKAILSKFKLSKKETLTDDEKNKLKLNYFLDGFEKIEKEKIEFFFLTYRQKTLIINAPSDNAKQKEFLGYDWSNRKGAEGIQIIKAGGKLYDDKDRFAKNTLASLIRQMFMNNTCQIGDEYQEYAHMVKTCDMLDFGLASFNYALRTNVQKKVEIESQYSLMKIQELCLLGRGRVISHDDIQNNQGDYPVYSSQTKNNGVMGKINTFDFEGDYVTWTTDGVYAGTCFYRTGKFNCTNVCGTLKIKDDKTNIIKYYYLSLILNTVTENYVIKSANPKLMNNKMAEIKIPIPPIDIQEKIIKECEEIDNEINQANTTIETTKQQIEQLFEQSLKQPLTAIRLNSADKFDISIGRRVLVTEVSTKPQANFLPVFSANVFEPFGFIEKDLLQDFSLPSVLWGIDGDWLVNYIDENQPFYPTDHCGVIRVKTDDINAKYLSFVLRKVGTEQRFSRSYRASTERIKALILHLPSIEVQNETVKQIIELEQQIQKAEQIIEQTAERKKSVLSKYL